MSRSGRGLTRVWWGLALVAGLIGAVPAPAAPGDENDDLTVFAEFGFQNQLPVERWAPMTVWISTGERAVSGVIRVEYRQDATQIATISSQFATTPGRSTPIEVNVCLPFDCDHLRIAIVDESGRLLGRLVYADIPGRGELQLPNLIVRPARLIAGVGRTSLSMAASAWKRTDVRPGRVLSADETWNRETRVVRVLPDRLPTTWIAYEGLAVLVVEAGVVDKVDPRAIEAIRRWVHAGGRLCIVASDPGSTWRTWLGPDAGLVRLAETDQGPIGSELASVIEHVRTVSEARSRGPSPGRRGASEQSSDEGVGTEAQIRTPAIEPTESAARRLVSLSGRARENAWRLRWAADGAGLIAEGPVGLGLVMVMGIDPARASAVLSESAAGAAWSDALGPMIDPLDPWEANNAYSWWYAGSGDSLGSRIAITEGLDHLSGLPPIGGLVFAAIAGAVLLMALLVGPVDYTLLRKLRAGQRSWLTAGSWIALSSLFAWAAPNWIRSGDTRASRLRVVDVIQGEAFAYETSLTGIFASRQGAVRLADPDPASWWRGVSPVGARYGQEGPVASGSIQTIQTWAGADNPRGRRGNPLRQVNLALWTFRTMMDQGIVSPPVRVSVEHLDPDWSVRVRGLAPGAQIKSAALRFKSYWMTLEPIDEPTADPDGTWNARALWKRSSVRTPRSWDRFNPGNTASWAETNNRPLVPGTILNLRGSDARGGAIERRLASGRWAGVYLWIERSDASGFLEGPASGTETIIARVLAPIREDPDDRDVSHGDGEGQREGKP